MSVLDRNVVDFGHEDDDKVTVCISDHIPWDSEILKAHLEVLQDKVNDYLDYIASKWQDSKYKSYFLSQAYWRGWVYSQQNKRDDYARYPDFQEAVYSHEKWLILIGSGYGKCKGNTQKDGIGESFAIQNI